jgi:hypothetical protein
MPLQIDRVDSEVQIMRTAATDAPTGTERHAGSDILGALRGDNALKEKIRPLVLEIMHDELDRMRRRVGSP